MGTNAFLLVNLLMAIAGVFLFKEKRMHKLTTQDIFHLFIFIMIFFAVSAIHIAEVKIDPLISAKFNLDFTKTIYGIEGDVVHAFQAIQNPILDYYFSFVYMLAFPFLLYFTPALYILSKDVKALKLAVISYAVGTSISLPFLLFFPVHDVWWASQNYHWYDGKVIAFRLQEIWPSITFLFFKFTTINNCFPSLHSCLSAIMAYTAWIKNYKRYKYVATVFAISIPIATLYLGIHWLTDVIAGEALALIAVVVAMKICGEKWK